MTVGRQATVAGLAVVDVVGLTLVRLDAARLARGVAHPQAWVDAVGADRALAELAGAGLWLAAAWLGVGLLAAAAPALPRHRPVGRPRRPHAAAAGRPPIGRRLGRRRPAREPGRRRRGHAERRPDGSGCTRCSAEFELGSRHPPAPRMAGQPGRSPPASTPAPSATEARRCPRRSGPRGRRPRCRNRRGPHPAPHHPAPAPRTPDPHASPAQGNPVRVRAGDCLWLIASRRLGTSATTEQIAAEWPRWYAANEGVIGSDPSTIRPGQVLRPPMPATKSQEASRCTAALRTRPAPPCVTIRPAPAGPAVRRRVARRPTVVPGAARPAAALRAHGRTDAGLAPGAAATAGTADPSAWGRRLLIGMIETAAGRRPLHQLAAMLSPSVSRGIGADFERAAGQGSAHWLHRAGVRSVRAAEPADGVAELCATVEARTTRRPSRCGSRNTRAAGAARGCNSADARNCQVIHQDEPPTPTYAVGNACRGARGTGGILGEGHRATPGGRRSAGRGTHRGVTRHCLGRRRGPDDDRLRLDAHRLGSGRTEAGSVVGTRRGLRPALRDDAAPSGRTGRHQLPELAVLAAVDADGVLLVATRRTSWTASIQRPVRCGGRVFGPAWTPVNCGDPPAAGVHPRRRLRSHDAHGVRVGEDRRGRRRRNVHATLHAIDPATGAERAGWPRSSRGRPPTVGRCSPRPRPTSDRACC